MNDRHSSSNVHGLPRLDRKDDPTFAQRLRLYWAPIATIGVIVAGTASAVVATTKPLTRKADASTVQRVQRDLAGDDDRITRLEVEVQDVKDGQHWTESVLGELAIRQGIQPPPLPPQHAHQTVTP